MCNSTLSQNTHTQGLEHGTKRAPWAPGPDSTLIFQ